MADKVEDAGLLERVSRHHTDLAAPVAAENSRLADPLANLSVPLATAVADPAARHTAPVADLVAAPVAAELAPAVGFVAARNEAVAAPAAPASNAFAAPLARLGAARAP
jgi:hypothetical protein